MTKHKELKELRAAIDQARLNKVLLLVELTGEPESRVRCIAELLNDTMIEYYLENPELFKKLRFQDVTKLTNRPVIKNLQRRYISN